MKTMTILSRFGALAAAAAMGIALTACKTEDKQISTTDSSKDYAADWAAIDTWPGEIAENASAEPNPDMVITAIVFDDSGSMGTSIGAAKDAVVSTIQGMNAPARVAVIGLNSGVILPTSDVSDAKQEVAKALSRVRADGGTPLGASMKQAYDLLTDEASHQRGFGVYRIIVTTDGEAGDEGVLKRNTAYILRNTPIQVSTIGVGIGAGHPLNLPGRTTYAAIDNVASLASALKTVSAEQKVFAPMAAFEKVN